MRGNTVTPWLPHDIRRLERKLDAGQRPQSIAMRLNRSFRELGRTRLRNGIGLRWQRSRLHVEDAGDDDGFVDAGKLHDAWFGKKGKAKGNTKAKAK